MMKQSFEMKPKRELLKQVHDRFIFYILFIINM